MSALAATVLLTAVAAQEPPVFQADVGVVRLEVLVTRNGAPVHGLTSADFQVREDGRLQKLEPALEQETPVDAVLVLDMSGSVKGAKLTALQEAARAFLDGLRHGEQAAVLAFREQVHLLQPLTPELDLARHALDQAVPQGSTALCDAVFAALRLREPSPNRTAVVVFSDGLDNMSWLTPGEVVEAASRSEAIIYGVARRERSEKGGSFLRDVCQATGGRYFEIGHERDLHARFLDVLADIRARYVLSFYPSAGATGWHALDVRVRNGEVLARPGYWKWP